MDEKFIMQPKVDYCFKALMENERVRNGFLSAVTKIPRKEIQGSRLLPTHLEKKSPDGKLGILDVRVELVGGVQIDIEIQVASSEYWAERSLYYLSRMYAEKIREGQDYEQLEKCIHIGILDFTLFEDQEFYSSFHLWEDKRKEMYTDKFEIHILELPKLTRYQYPETELLEWARFLNAEQKEVLQVESDKNPDIAEAMRELEKISRDETKKAEYDARLKAIRDYRFYLKMSEQRGFEAGKTEGVQEGLEQGKLILIMNMLKKGMEVKDILYFAGVSEEEVEEAKKLLE
ncbi:MAG TPA: Rpn family recombination-promoting nuclease/putative transposase [Candidatus Blautia ornithocaccae]|nr:Rpn family recombination-promoting nuclease/putative transposase [Candidatus Blautia ornithocaccae]